ncbi:hypothetical protein HGRIS_002847 [Hohenbuehelia grisea]|uniref:Glucanase n=1 Tax=Hohenbuehelia grisea TaxID=104357 RepID=A0ABR3JNM7_9AGAR
MLSFAALYTASLLGAVCGQQAGTLVAENHPPLAVTECAANGCIQTSKAITLDSNWRWLHTTQGFTSCISGNQWDASICSDPVACSTSCALDGADYSSTYGIRTSGNSLTLKYVYSSPFRGSRTFLLDNDSTYKLFNLKNKELAFDVDVSQLPCGLNGALYFAELPADGGISTQVHNKAGAKYGTGYCDSKCPHELKFIAGEANILDWTPSNLDPNSGTGRYGACCAEMDIWEANSISSAYTAHPCSADGLHRCEGSECDGGPTGVCDKDGCDFNPYRLGSKAFFGRGKTIDTNKKFTVLTQFITSNGTAAGDLTEVRRFYVQNGVVRQNSVSSIPGVPASNSLTDSFCSAQKSAFGDTDSFAPKGGLAGIGKAFERGMVLVMSIEDDSDRNMLWLDGTYPPHADPLNPGVVRGECSAGEGIIVEPDDPAPQVKFSNIRYGDLGSTTSVNM